jgi:psp operon transcriptional activator
MYKETAMIGSSAALASALAELSRLAGIDRPVLILGPRGSGKELAAERLHYLSARWSAPLHKINCAALTETLLESELFGHETGAFTGAVRQHCGHFERAEGGSLLLDEFHTLSLRVQEKLLRVLEYGEFERVGGQRTLRADVRIVAASNVDLRAAAQAGRLREDLLDRLCFDAVHLPGLAQRREDIIELATHFAQRLCAELGRPYFAGFGERATQILLAHSWPGNVRELKNTVERALFRWESVDLPVDDLILDPLLSPFAGDTQALPPQVPTPSDTQALTEPMALHPRIAAYERALVLDALEACHWHQGKAAERLSLSYDQLRGLLRKHRIRRQR